MMNLGFIGLGAMGRPMALHLLDAGHALHVYARAPDRAAKARAALLGGSAYSRILEVHGQRMLTRDFVPGFRARLHQKDLGIVLNEAREKNLALPATAAAAQLLNALVAAGEGELDSSALVKIVERLAGLDT